MLLSQQQLTEYCQMPVADRARLDGITKKRIIEALVGRPVSVVFCEVYDPVDAAADVLALDGLPHRTGRESREVMTEQFFHNARRGGYR